MEINIRKDEETRKKMNQKNKKKQKKENKSKYIFSTSNMGKQ